MPRPLKFQINKVIEYLLRNGADGLVTRSLAWCLGRVPDEEYYHEVAEYVKDLKHGTEAEGQNPLE
jgi:hypothetical protein